MCNEQADSEVIDCPGAIGVPLVPHDMHPTKPDCMGACGRSSTAPAASRELYDSVRRPEHYARLTPEPIEVIEGWDAPFHVGNIIKYAARLVPPYKHDPIEDASKLIRYAELYKAYLLRRRAR
jgi:hypothetical protein